MKHGQNNGTLLKVIPRTNIPERKKFVRRACRISSSSKILEAIRKSIYIADAYYFL